MQMFPSHDPMLYVAETPDGCTTAEPSIVADPSDEEKEIPLFLLKKHLHLLQLLTIQY